MSWVGRETTAGRFSLAVRLVSILAITVPLLGVVAAPFFVWGWEFGWVDLGLLLDLLTALGITVGFHRLFVYRSFEMNSQVKFILAVLGSMAVQGSLFDWVTLHRRRYPHSDTPELTARNSLPRPSPLLRI